MIFLRFSLFIIIFLFNTIDIFACDGAAPWDSRSYWHPDGYFTSTNSKGFPDQVYYWDNQTILSGSSGCFNETFGDYNTYRIQLLAGGFHGSESECNFELRKPVPFYQPQLENSLVLYGIDYDDVTSCDGKRYFSGYLVYTGQVFTDKCWDGPPAYHDFSMAFFVWGFDKDIYSASHRHVGEGNWVFEVKNTRDNTNVPMSDYSKLLLRYDVDISGWVVNEGSITDIFDAQAFVDDSEKGVAYKVEFQINNSACKEIDFFSAYQWFQESNCSDNSVDLLLADYGEDYIITGSLLPSPLRTVPSPFEIWRYQDIKGKAPLELLKFGYGGKTGVLSRKYKYQARYEDVGVKYQYDFYPTCGININNGNNLGVTGNQTEFKGGQIQIPKRSISGLKW